MALSELEHKSISESQKYHYIFIDEAQDLPDEFIKLCSKVSEKIFVAFDIFQSIFDTVRSQVKYDFSLTYCYRPPPYLLMFAHTLGFGLKDVAGCLQWFEKPEQWEQIGYKIVKGDPGIDNSSFQIQRTPLSRFDEDNQQELYTYPIKNDNETNATCIISIIHKIVKDYDLEQRLNEIVIIDARTYNLNTELKNIIASQLSYEIHDIREEKNISNENKIHFSNINNIKGLEFCFVIGVGFELTRSIIKRNATAMGITRSLLEAHLLINLHEKIKTIYDNIKRDGYIETVVPTDEKRKEIKNFLQQNDSFMCSREDIVKTISAEFPAIASAKQYDQIIENLVTMSEKIETKETLQQKIQEIAVFFGIGL